MLDTLPLIAGLIVSLLIIAGVIYRGIYSATVYMVRRMQRKGEIPEMDKMNALEVQVTDTAKKVAQTQAVVYELEHTVKNGLSTKAEESREWQREYGPKLDRLIGTLNEHLRQSGS